MTTDNFFYYITKNVSAADKAASVNPGEVTGTKDVDNFDILAYEVAHTFDGSEDYAHPLTRGEARNARLSPVFMNYANMSFNDVWAKASEIVELQFVGCRKVMDYFAAHYLQNYNTWTDADRVVYAKQLYPLAEAMSMGSLPVMQYELSLFINTSDPNYTAPAAPLDTTIVQGAIDFIDLMMEKMPR